MSWGSNQGRFQPGYDATLQVHMYSPRTEGFWHIPIRSLASETSELIAVAVFTAGKRPEQL